MLLHPSFVSEISADFLPVRFNLIHNWEVQARYGISATPSLLILNGDGKVLVKQVGQVHLARALELLQSARDADQ